MSDLHTINFQQELDLIESKISQLTVTDLVQCLEDDLVESLESLDEPINSPNLAKTIISLYGTRIFDKKIIRNAFCELANLKEIQSWNKSKECKNLLLHFGLSEIFLPQKKEKREILNNIKPNFTLHDYQEWMKKRVSFFLLDSKKEKLMVQLPTGAGKTSLMMESIFDYFRVSTSENSMIVWMAHTDELCEQAIESFERGWKERGTFEINIIRLWGGNAGKIKSIPDKPNFLVTSFQSAYKMIQTKNDAQFEVFSQINRRCNLLVVDEAHMSLAPTYNAAIRLFSGRNSKIIGLTATPGRHGLAGDNNETLELVDFFQNNIINMNEFSEDLTPIEYLQKKKILSTVIRQPLITNYEIELDSKQRKSFQETLALPDSALKKIGEDDKRNLTILSQIIKLRIEHEKKILVFATSKDNSNLLASLLTSRGIRSKSITSDTEFTDRKQSVEDFKEGKLGVLINYNVFTTGFDDPLIDCVLIARPTYSVILYSQMIGRGLRGEENGGTKDCLIVDVIDNLVSQPDAKMACNFFEEEWNLKTGEINYD